MVNPGIIRALVSVVFGRERKPDLPSSASANGPAARAQDAGGQRAPYVLS